MSPLTERSGIYIDETERKPNRYAANVLTWVVGVIAIVAALNRFGIFEVSHLLVGICLAVSLGLLAVMQIIVHNPRSIVHPASKYVIMSMVLLLVLTITVLLNIHAVLGFVLPLLLATQYRSYHISRLALIGSVICCFIAPILSYLLDTWSLVFLTGYIQTFCRVSIEVVGESGISVGSAISQITLYWSLPQMLTILAFGSLLFSATKTGITSVNNQMQVLDLSRDLSAQLQSISSIQEKALYAMSEIIESRDEETGGHVRRTSEIVRLLLDAMRRDPENEISDQFYYSVIRSAPMHDLGKISIPDAILRKPGRLSREEYEIVKQHPLKSAEIIRSALTGVEDEALLHTAENIAKYHHEKMDGSGYPEGLSGESIPLEARIMALADVYDALVSERCYKKPMAYDEAFRVIEESMGTQFDSKLNPYFVECVKQIEEFYQNE